MKKKKNKCKIATIIVDNTDNVLPYQKWHEFIHDIWDICDYHGDVVFCGGSSSDHFQHNYCVVTKVDTNNIPHMKLGLEEIQGWNKKCKMFYVEGEIASIKKP